WCTLTRKRVVHFNPQNDKVMQAQGALPQHVVLRQRIRYFSNGVAIGTALFVDKLIDEWSPQIGDRRKRRSKQIEGFGGIASFGRVNARI
ncbi:MAG: hypothetical protein ACPGN3_15165, partial [Opitutales bacterium]